MTSKTFEIRDCRTFIAVLATKLTPDGEADRYLLGRAGFTCGADGQGKHVLLTQLSFMVSNYDPFSWPNRSIREAHEYIRLHYDTLEDGAVIDVEYLLGESAAPKAPERLA